MQNRDLLQELPNSMNREKRPLDTDVLVEFEKKPFEVQDFRKFTNRFVESTEEWYLELIKKDRTITTCNQLDLETLGFWLIMPKNLYGDWTWQAYINLSNWSFHSYSITPLSTHELCSKTRVMDLHRKLETRSHVGVIWCNFHAFQLLLTRFTQGNLCCISLGGAPFIKT